MAVRSKERLTNKEVLKLLRMKYYEIDPDIGEVISINTGEPIYTYEGTSGNRWCRLYAWGKKRALPVAHVIWMYMTKSIIPKGFQIHHDDKNPANDRWTNLFCVHKMDHEKIHRTLGPVPEEQEIPF